MSKSLRILELFFQENEESNSVLDGKSKQSAKTLIYKLTDEYLRGSFTDEYWQPINSIFKIFKDKNIDYTLKSTEYDREIPNKSKTWFFDIVFIDNKNKKQTLTCQLKAHGGGSIQEPLDRYDLTLIMN